MILKTLIEKFNNCQDDDEKVSVILENFTELEDVSKWKFLIEILNDENAYDLVKIEIYKIIQIEKFNNETIIEIKNGMLTALKNEEDELVKQWGFISLQFNFCNFSDVIEFCVQTIEKTEEDEDVVYNALSVLEKSDNQEILNQFKNRLLNINSTESISNSIAKLFK